MTGDNWLIRPTPIPAIIFGVVTVLAPFFIGVKFFYVYTLQRQWTTIQNEL